MGWWKNIPTGCGEELYKNISLGWGGRKNIPFGYWGGMWMSIIYKWTSKIMCACVCVYIYIYIYICYTKQKINLIKTLTHRALIICSESTLDSEIKFISETLANNGFPLSVIQTFIVNKITEFIKPKQASVQKCPVYLCLPWLDGISKQITQTIQRFYFSSNICVVFHTKPILASIRKDVLPPHHNNNFLIYLFRSSCSLSNIGRTN